MDDGFSHSCHSLDQDHRGLRQGRAKLCSQGSGEAGARVCRQQEVGGGQGCVPLSQDLDKRTEVPSCPFHHLRILARPDYVNLSKSFICEMSQRLHT